MVMVRILVVDDSPAMRQEVSSALTGAGFEVIQGADGVEALELIRANPDLALIILDVNMPRMDGLTTLEAMRAQNLPAIKTVMLTTEGQTKLIERGKRAGAKGWLIKPIKREHLIAVAQRLTTAETLTVTGTTFVVPR
jgi:two-component system chemotaxis response regulator CheY